MIKVVASTRYTKAASSAINDLQEKIDVLESKGFRAVGPAQVFKEDDGNIVAYITMKL